MKRFYLWLLLTTIISISNAHAKPSIEWYENHFPPATIKQGTFKGQGILDKSGKLIRSSLPQYLHHIFEASLSRIWLEIEHGKFSCNNAALKTPQREENAYFSKPVFIVLPIGVMTSAKPNFSLEKYLNEDNTINIEDLLNHSDLQVAIAKKRSYNNSIDKLLSQNRQRGNILSIADLSPSARIMDLTLSNKVDLAFLYPAEIEFLFSTGKKRKPFRFYPISNISPYSFGYIACSKTPQGKAIIKAVNEVIESERSTFAQFYKQWLDHKFHKQYDDYFRQAFGYGID